MSNAQTALQVSEYLNPWHSSRSLDPRIYKTTAKPIEYRGYQIFHRIDCCWDVVSDGVCIGRYAGKSGATGLIDKIVDTLDDFWAARAIEAKRSGLGQS